MSKIIGVIDEPVAPGSTDNLDLKIHSKSLIDSAQHCGTGTQSTEIQTTHGFQPK